MRSIETSFAFPLAAVKPFERLHAYRTYCVDATHAALKGGTESRPRCPACGAPSSPWNKIESFEYARCIQCSTLYLQDMPEAGVWADLLSKVSRHRASPGALDASMLQSRAENVYEPKLDWIHSTLRLQGVMNPRLIEVTTSPSQFSHVLSGSSSFAGTQTVEERDLYSAPPLPSSAAADAAVLLESLDRAYDPMALVQGVSGILKKGALLFVTALVSSGFDMVVLGAGNMYLYPPDRTNCFSLAGLEKLLVRAGYKLIELSTPGVLDVEVVAAHYQHNTALKLSTFERQLLMASKDTRMEFQAFLQQNRLSSFARAVARKAS